MARPFTDGFPAAQASAGGITDWPENVPDEAPTPEVPGAPAADLTPNVDPDFLPDDAPPVDLLTGLPNAALSQIPEEFPGDDDVEGPEDHPGLFDWI